MDVSAKTETLKSNVDRLVEKYKKIDILINNAGISFRGEVRCLAKFTSRFSHTLINLLATLLGI